MTVRRNAFGRQVDSFEGDIEFAGLDEPVRAVFIRAPWVERVGDGVQVLARAAGHVVAVRQGPMLATAFHPEMTGDRRIHQLFVDIVRGAPEPFGVERFRRRACVHGFRRASRAWISGIFHRHRTPEAVIARRGGCLAR